MFNRRKIIIILAMIFVFIYTLCFINVNNKYRGYIIHKFKINECTNYHNINITISKFETFPSPTLKNLYDNITINNENGTYLLATTILENKTNELQKINLSQIILSSSNWYTNISLYTFYSLNPNISSLLLELAPHETLTIILPFSYDEHYFGNISKRKFQLEFIYGYPYLNEKNIIFL